MFPHAGPKRPVDRSSLDARLSEMLNRTEEGKQMMQISRNRKREGPTLFPVWILNAMCVSSQWI